MKNLNLSRRGFLKAAAATATALSVSPQAALKPASAQTLPDNQTKIVKTLCRACMGDCAVLAHVKEGRVIKLEGNPESPRNKGTLCTKGLSGIQALYNPMRNKYPMERVGKRGENKWKRISWDEAIDKIARKLMDIRKEYGAEAVMGSTGGGGNPNFMSTGRFCNAFGTPNWFEPGAAQCYLPRMLASSLVYSFDHRFYANCSISDTNCLELFHDDAPVKSYVMWGAAPSYSGPAHAGRILANLRAKNVKTVVIDPRMTPDAAKADVWIQIRPGTDVAMALSWVRYVIDKKRYDKDFVLRWTNMPFLVNPKTNMFFRENELKNGGDENTFVVWDEASKSAKAMPYPYDEKLSPALEGTYKVGGAEYKPAFQLLKERAAEWTFKKAGEVCHVDPAIIEKGAQIYAENAPGGITLGVATDQNPNSFQAAHITILLDMLMGNVEKPGAIYQRFGMSPIAPETSPLVMALPPEQLKKRLGGNEHKGLLLWWTAQPPAILEAMKTGKPYPIKAWLERSGNKMGVVANASEWVDAMKNLDLIVHMYMYPTSFTAYADFILPINEWLETDFISHFTFNQLYVRQAVTHLYETVNEMWIWSKLAKRCAELGHEGCKRAFDPKATAPEAPYFNTYEEQLDAWAGIYGKTFNYLKEHNPYEYLPYDKWRSYYVYKQIDEKTGKPRGFDTPSKKLELYLESLINLARTGQPLSPYPLPPASKDYDPLPYYMEPAESPHNDIGKAYPLTITNGRLPIYHHGTLRNIPYLREITPTAEIWVNPVDAKKYSVAQGDWVWVESMRGKIRAKAIVTEGIQKGVVYMERFWNPETLNTPTQGWQEMNVNVLSRSEGPYNDVVGTYTLRGFQVKIYKADGAPEGIWQKPEEFRAWMPQPSAPTKKVEVKS